VIGGSIKVAMNINEGHRFFPPGRASLSGQLLCDSYLWINDSLDAIQPCPQVKTKAVELELRFHMRKARKRRFVKNFY
jgi:hypothetical protein